MPQVKLLTKFKIWPGKFVSRSWKVGNFVFRFLVGILGLVIGDLDLFYEVK